MKKGFLKKVWILILIAVMVLPPLRMADAASSRYYTSIVVHKNPNKMYYDLGESFDKTGMEIFGNWYDPETGETGIYKLLNKRRYSCRTELCYLLYICARNGVRRVDKRKNKL